jgi:hypothetical protein
MPVATKPLKRVKAVAIGPNNYTYFRLSSFLILLYVFGVLSLYRGSASSSELMSSMPNYCRAMYWSAAMSTETVRSLGRAAGEEERVLKLLRRGVELTCAYLISS